jgi:hypothetical protein
MAQEASSERRLNNITEERPKPYVSRPFDQAICCLRSALRDVDRLSNLFRPKSHAGSKIIPDPDAEPRRFGAPGFRRVV